MLLSSSEMLCEGCGASVLFVCHFRTYFHQHLITMQNINLTIHTATVPDNNHRRNETIDGLYCVLTCNATFGIVSYCRTTTTKNIFEYKSKWILMWKSTESNINIPGKCGHCIYRFDSEMWNCEFTIVHHLHTTMHIYIDLCVNIYIHFILLVYEHWNLCNCSNLRENEFIRRRYG